MCWAPSSTCRLTISISASPSRIDHHSGRTLLGIDLLFTQADSRRIKRTGLLLRRLQALTIWKKIRLIQKFCMQFVDCLVDTLPYNAQMARCVTYQIFDMPDGRFSVTVTVEPDKTMVRTGFTTQAEVSAWVDGLRDIMAALGAPVSLAYPEYPGSLPLNEVLAFIRKAPTVAD